MKRISSGILLAVALAMPAMAADIAAKAPIYKAAPRVLAYNWTGFYVGAHAGYGWGTADIDISNFGANWCVPCQGTLIANGTPSLRVDGYVVGGQAGFNQQVGQWVFGVEADLASARLKGSRTTGVITSPGLQPVSFAERVDADWIFTLRPRIGFAFDSVLVYATGGLAVAHYEFSQILTFIPPRPMAAPHPVPRPDGPSAADFHMRSARPGRSRPNISTQISASLASAPTTAFSRIWTTT
jgi:outer membrane immunogenic protein